MLPLFHPVVNNRTRGTSVRVSFTGVLVGLRNQSLRSDLVLVAELNPTSLAMRTAR